MRQVRGAGRGESGESDVEYSGRSDRRCAWQKKRTVSLTVSHEVLYPTSLKAPTNRLTESSQPVFLRQKSATWFARAMPTRPCLLPELFTSLV